MVDELRMPERSYFKRIAYTLGTKIVLGLTFVALGTAALVASYTKPVSPIPGCVNIKKYVVKPGDNLWQITNSLRNQNPDASISLRDLALYSGVDNPSSIQVDDSLFYCADLV